MLSNGTRLAGRYEIIHFIGGGGMASVYQAYDHALDRWVAIKVMNESLRHQDEFIKRFIREAKAAGRLSHPNVVNVYDIGQEESIYYMVMEYVEGGTLAEYLEEKGPLLVDEVMEIALQVCEGLNHAHQNGIVHRDIKLQNIMRAKDNRYKVADFGISFFSHVNTNLTQTGTVMGSAHYFSPEQASGGKVSYPSDLYSLGVLLFKLLTDQFPFDSENSVSIALMHIQAPVPDPRQVNPNISESFVSVLNKLLEKDPTTRFQTAIEVKQAIEEIQKQPTEMIYLSKETESVPSTDSYRFETTTYDLPPRQEVHQQEKGGVRWKLWGGGLLSIGVLLAMFVYGWNLFAEETKPPVPKKNVEKQKKVQKQVVDKKKNLPEKTFEGSYPWWREFPKPNYLENKIFHSIQVDGKAGVYKVSLQVAPLPKKATRFHYNIYVVDSFSSRKILDGKEVNFNPAPNQFGDTSVKFKVKIPKQLLPHVGLLKIEIFRYDEKRKKKDPTDNMLEQWGEPPDKANK
ncbi:Serine/threonine protein kinase [Seinonella peptonophila]|uniref:Serine/threonine-protein kinase PrkC n=1 Tax=Seinonella peptonophila TaxID=112248 RepID=A0A1M4SZC5_9BACL|nr:protein kinase [Seinonella peptonophila]SHE37586.1 Serine/threonine protein kinase [Seinonella peptonophila]